MATPKKKHLIELMIEAGVKWPEGAEYAAQDKDQEPGDRELDLINIVSFYPSKPEKNHGEPFWFGDSNIDDDVKLSALCNNWHQTIVTREQYAKAVAAINNEQKPQYCASVMRQMPSETIESLLAEIKTKREEHSELVAKAEALALEITSIEQQVNDKLKKHGFSLYPAAASSEIGQPVITDWRDLQAGDVIKCIPYGDERDNTSRWPGGWAPSIVDTIHIVESIDHDSGKISLLNTKDSGYAFQFNHRP